MHSVGRSVLVVGTLLTGAPVIGFAEAGSPLQFVTIDQNVDQGALQKFHHTDQGTQVLPAAWLAALEKADGSGKFMSSDNLGRMGFLVDNVVADRMNPYGWPIGFTVSDPKTTDGIPIAGVNCAACHTGQVEYKGTAVRIEGGQAMISWGDFNGDLSSALTATAKDPSRRARFFAEAIKAGYPADRMEADFTAAVAGFAGDPGVSLRSQLLAGNGRSDAVQGIVNRIFVNILMVPENAREGNAPVSFPYLWDIGRLSWVEYNGAFTRDSTSRNIMQLLGVFAKTHVVDPKTGVLNPEPLRWQTSIQLGNLIWMEKTVVARLRAPTWPAAVLGAIDQPKAQRGRQLFAANCARCHGIKELPDGGWDVTVIPLKAIGTDPRQATNFSAYTYDGTKVGLSKQAHGVDGDVLVNAVRKQLYAENHTPASEQEHDVKYVAPCGYRARPLIGVWATPPFLHNGSVRTVFDLLSDTRPAKFTVGSREYDPIHLGYTEGQSVIPTTVLDTSLTGNSNAGHWWTNDAGRPGRIGPKLADADKYALIEYLKAATYENYPSEKRATMAVMPCQGDPDWASKTPAAAAK
jgi:processive rubber oxygenase RoxA-like protein/cytochrome c